MRNSRELSQKIETIEAGLTGLEKLDNKFHTTMSGILDNADRFLSKEDLSVGEWSTITKGVSDAYGKIFNDSGVKVNVNNGTQFSDSKLSMFKGALRG